MPSQKTLPQFPEVLGVTVAAAPLCAVAPAARDATWATAGFLATFSAATKLTENELAMIAAAHRQLMNRHNRPTRKLVTIVSMSLIAMSLTNLPPSWNSLGCRAALKLYHVGKYARCEK
jgi:hypothetical protein